MNIVAFAEKLTSNLKDQLGMSLTVRSNLNIMQEAFYIPSEKCIEINELLLEKAANNLNIDLKDYAFIIISHEVGHALDHELIKIDTDINRYQRILKTQGYKEEVAKKLVACKLKAEQNAWNIAEDIIPPKFNSIFKQIKTESLEKSKEIFYLEKELFKRSFTGY
ncbi:hypothetical protein [Priestia megaterium]|uniref:hypothetical protein n=1 Tax=Priestia megaterium TaxID=1404 RepID=UPI000BF31683|nr:hypothetical protein [Priestia megaterium]PFR91119.1 hypothetical protein COK39_24140 [Priestia megaterium]